MPLSRVMSVSDPGSISSFTCTTPPCHESILQLVPVQSPISSNSCQIRGSAEWPVEHCTALGTTRESPDGETLLPTGMLERKMSQQSSQLQNELTALKNSIHRSFKSSQPIYDPTAFHHFCIKSGAPNIFKHIHRLMTSGRRKEKRECEIER